MGFFFFKGCLRAVSKFIKIFIVKIFTSFSLTLLHCFSSHISNWFLLPHLSWAPFAPQHGWYVCAPPSHTQAAGVPLLIRPYNLASPPLGQHFILHSPLQSLPWGVALRAFLPLCKLLSSLPASLFDCFFFNLPLFKDLVFSEVTSFPLNPSQTQSGDDETKIRSQPHLPQPPL